MPSARTVEKTMDILQFISMHPEGVTLTEVYKSLNLPKVTVYDILKRLYDQEALYYRDYRAKKYAIGPKMFSIGQAFANNTNFIDLVKDEMIEYANKYKVTVFASTRMKDYALYTFKTESEDVRLHTKGIGVQIPLTDCPDGKCYLAFEKEMTDEELSQSIKDKYFFGKEDEEYNTLMKVIMKARRLGYLCDCGITESFVYALAFPIFNFENRMVGVISMVKFKNDNDSCDMNGEIEELKIIRDKINNHLGYGMNNKYSK